MSNCICCDLGHKNVVAKTGDRWCRQCQADGCAQPKLAVTFCDGNDQGPKCGDCAGCLREKLDVANLQIERYRTALKDIYKNEGPGLDGSLENASGKIARLALEGVEKPVEAKP